MVSQAIGEFFLSEWIWSMTLGIHQAPLAAFFSFLLFKFYGKIRIAPSALLSVFANIFSFFLYSFLVSAILIYFMHYEFTSLGGNEHPHSLYSPFLASQGLGLIYTVLQAFFFACVHLRYPLELKRVIMMAFIANSAAAFVIYFLLPANY